jgi:hypothetical protein
MRTLGVGGRTPTSIGWAFCKEELLDEINDIR